MVELYLEHGKASETGGWKQVSEYRGTQQRGSRGWVTITMIPVAPPPCTLLTPCLPGYGINICAQWRFCYEDFGALTLQKLVKDRRTLNKQMHNKGFIRQAYRTGARKQTLLGRAAAGRGWALSRASIIMISTPVPSHPPPSTPGPGPGHHNSSWRHDYPRHRPLFVLPGVAAAARYLSLFGPWQHQYMDKNHPTSEITNQIDITFNDIEELDTWNYFYTARTFWYSWCFSLEAAELVKVTSGEIDEARFVIPPLLSH